MNEMSTPGADWPVAEVDPIRRMRVLAAATLFPVNLRESLVPAPMDRVWAVAADLEHELPRMLSTVRSVRITQLRGEELELLAVGVLGQRARFDVVLRPGWCVMRSRFVLGAMAAAPEGEGTRFAALVGYRLPGARLMRPALSVLGDHAWRRFLEHPALQD